MDSSSLSLLSDALIGAFEKDETSAHDKKVVVNPVVSKFASWFEKLRNSMDYREEEVVLRAAVERILRRRLLLGGQGKNIAPPLVRELVWARYFPNESVSESYIDKIHKKIDLYLALRREISHKHRINENYVNGWIYDLMSADIEYLLNPKREKEIMSNFMFHVLRENVTITDDSEQTKDAQVFIAVRRSFAKDDRAFLRFHLFSQVFGQVTEESVPTIAEKFLEGSREIEYQLHYPRKDRIFNYIKNKTPIFLIMEDIFNAHKGAIKQLIAQREELEKRIEEACTIRYGGIAAKVKRAIIRSVIFILLTKVFFAFAIEGTYENIVYGHIVWLSMALNITIPPILMIIVGYFIRTPGKENTRRIVEYINSILFHDHPRIGSPLSIKKKQDKGNFLYIVFSILWLFAFFVSFGALVYILTFLHFNIVSQGIFIFFLAIVSFLSYRIGVTSRAYTVEENQGIFTPIVDFFFMPVIQVGRHLTEGISQINIFLFLFDYLIETPFKGLFAFFEQWFFFLHAKREELE